MTDTFTSNETVLKFQCEDRNYENWCILNNELLLKLTDDIHNAIFKDFDPIQHKLINQDIFTYDKEQNKVTLVHSSVRSMTTIGGILVLDGDKKYGKFKDKIYIVVFLMTHVFLYLQLHTKAWQIYFSKDVEK